MQGALSIPLKRVTPGHASQMVECGVMKGGEDRTVPWKTNTNGTTANDSTIATRDLLACHYGLRLVSGLESGPVPGATPSQGASPMVTLSRLVSHTVAGAAPDSHRLPNYSCSLAAEHLRQTKYSGPQPIMKLISPRCRWTTGFAATAHGVIVFHYNPSPSLATRTDRPYAPPDRRPPHPRHS
jgi:hypothetical protein